jgi:hypothetical protein
MLLDPQVQAFVRASKEAHYQRNFNHEHFGLDLQVCHSHLPLFVFCIEDDDVLDQ